MCSSDLSLIISADYHFIYFDGINRFYIADEHSQLDSAFYSPPNIWDEFIPTKEYEIRQKYQYLQGQYEYSQRQHQHQYQQLQGQYQQLQGQYQQLQGQYQHLSKEMYDLKHGRIWRLTAPFRRVGDLERHLKQRLAKKVVTRDRLNLGKIKVTLTHKLLRTVQQNPGLESIALKLIPQSLRQILRAKLTSLSATKSPNLEDLSDYAVDFFYALKSERKSK